MFKPGISGDSPNASSNNSAKDRIQLCVLAAVLFLASTLPYLPTLGAPPHLDDQHLLAWLGQLRISNFSHFLFWSGPATADAWGPVVPLLFYVTQICSGGLAFCFQLSGVLIHSSCTFLVYVLLKQLSPTRERFLPLLSALLFALYPLHPEAVSWISGRSSELSTLFALGFACLYLSAIQTTSVKRPAAALACLACALLSSWNSWVMAPAMLLWVSCNRSFFPGKRLLCIQVLSPLMLLAAFYIVAGSAISKPVLDSGMPDWQNIFPLLKNMLLPVNQFIWHGYSKQYLIFYIVLALPAVSLPAAMVLDGKKRRLAIWLICWWLLSVLPYLNYAPTTTDLYGSRWLYPASVPLCALLAASFAWFGELTSYGKQITKGIAIVTATALCILFAFHLENQTMAYRVAGKVLSHIQKSARTIASQETAPFVLIRDIPAFTTVVPGHAPERICILDGTTGLLRSDTVSAGKLKDLLAGGQLASTTLLWEKTLAALLPVVLIPAKDSFGTIDGAAIAQKLQPGLSAYRNICHDPTSNELVAEGNPTSGPIIRFSADGMSPLDTNFLYVDALIDTPQPTNPQLEMFWLSGLYQDYSAQERHASTPVTINDKQFHRYYLPLRQVGWITGGPPLTITLGFPAGSKVRIKQIGTDPGQSLLPQLSLTGNTPAEISNHFDSPYYNFPDYPELGLCTLSRNRPIIDLDYAAGNVTNAVACQLQIYKSGNKHSCPPYKTIDLSQLQGHLRLSRTEFGQPGLYYLQLAATNPAGQQVGALSDKIVCLVRRN